MVCWIELFLISIYLSWTLKHESALRDFKKSLIINIWIILWSHVSHLYLRPFRLSHTYSNIWARFQSHDVGMQRLMEEWPEITQTRWQAAWLPWQCCKHTGWPFVYRGVCLPPYLHLFPVRSIAPSAACSLSSVTVTPTQHFHPSRSETQYIPQILVPASQPHISHFLNVRKLVLYLWEQCQHILYCNVDLLSTRIVAKRQSDIIWLQAYKD